MTPGFGGMLTTVRAFSPAKPKPVQSVKILFADFATSRIGVEAEPFVGSDIGVRGFARHMSVYVKTFASGRWIK